MCSQYVENFQQELQDALDRLQQQEERLLRERASFRSILNKAPFGVLMFDEHEHCLYANQEFTRITGHTLQDVPTLEDWFCKAYPDPSYRRHVMETWAEDTTQRVSRIFDVTCADGQVREVELHSTLVERDRAVLVLSDVTERRRAERALQESEHKFRSIVEQSSDGIVLVDEQGRIVEWNRGQEQICGLCREEVLGEFLWEVQFQVLPDEQQTSAVRMEIKELVTGMLNTNHRPWSHQLLAREIRCPDGTRRVMQSMIFPISTDEGFMLAAISRDITESSRYEEALQQRNRELMFLNRVGQILSSTLDMDHILITLLEEVRRLLGVVAASVWLIDFKTGDLVCRQVTGPQHEQVRGWRLAPGQGLAGWTVSHEESVVVADASRDERYFTGVDEETGLALRSILTVPMRTQQRVLGVIQVVDTAVGRFSPPDLAILEPLAATAAVAVENARLYQQAQRDAETKTMLLHEVNHRVKNVLTAIVGMLYAEKRRARADQHGMYRRILRNLINRVQSLATVHTLLSSSEWAPLLLSELATRIVHSVLQTLPNGKLVSVEIPFSTIRVTADQAHNLALVINELAMNTVKHVMDHRNKGRISIYIQDEGEWVLLTFRDDGPGYPEEVLQLECSNVGFDLIQRIVKSNLGGEVSLYNEPGAVALITFKNGVEMDEEGRG